MAFRLTFFKIPEHRVYSYKPRYYDEAKERIQEAEEKYHPKESQSGKYIPGLGIREAYRKGVVEGRKRQAGGTKTNGLILFVTLILLFVAAYYLAKLLEPLLN